MRLEVVEEISPAMIDFLLQQFQLDEQDLYHTDGPVNLYRLREVLTEIDRPDLKYPAFNPSVPAALEVGDDDLFETIARQDVLVKLQRVLWQRLPRSGMNLRRAVLGNVAHTM